MRVLLVLALLAWQTSAMAAEDDPHAGHHDPAQAHSHVRPDSHAPIGVMGEHVHAAGEWMVSYRYSRMRMDGNRNNDDSLRKDQVLRPPAGTGSFMASPTDMDMEMHMFGLMVAPTDWVTFMAMIPYVELQMDHVRMDGVRFRTRSDGVGDLRISGLVPVLKGETHKAHLNLGMSFPTGSINHRDSIPGLGGVRLPYPMQIGSGTFDVLPGITYLGAADSFSWGAQVMGTIRTEKNDNHWKLGDRVDLTGWVAIPWFEWVSTSARIAYAHWGDVRGSDSKLNPMMVPTADPNLRGGDRIDLLAGLNFLMPSGPLAGHRIAVEGGFPIFQHLDGPQLETDWRVTVGWQKAF